MSEKNLVYDINQKYNLYKNNKINALELINEVYDDSHLTNHNRTLILDKCSILAIKKMIKVNLKKIDSKLYLI